MLKAQLSGKMPNIGNDAGQKFSKGFGGGLKGIGASLGLALGTGAVVNFTKGLIGAAEEEIKGNKRLEAIATSMKLFGDQTGSVVKRLEDYASNQQAMIGIDDDVVKGTQAKLLTFAALAKTADTAGGAFDRATQASIDLAAAGFGTAEGNAIQLGKALQDPVKGITALSRSGVTFTASEKERIKTLVESNRIGEAQNLVLQAIETQVGGTANATASAGDKMNGAWQNLQETIGLKLLPVFNSFVTWITTVGIPAVQDFMTKFENGQTPLNTVFDTISGLINFVKENWVWISTLATAVIGAYGAFQLLTFGVNLYKGVMTGIAAVQAIFSAATAIQEGATWSAAAAQWGLNTALLANPITWIIIAIAALVAGLVYFFTQTEQGQQIWTAFTDIVGAAFGFLWDNILKPIFDVLGAALKFIGDIFGWLWNNIIGPIIDIFAQTFGWLWDTILKPIFDFIGGAVKLVGDAWGNTFGGMIDFIAKNFPGIFNIIKAPINGIIGLINGMIDAINSLKITIPDWIPLIGGQTWSLNIPKIPMLADGGFVTGPTTAVIGEAGPEVVTPLADFKQMMGLNKPAGDQPIMADGMGLIGWMRREANGQAKIVFNTELGKTALGAR